MNPTLCIHTYIYIYMYFTRHSYCTIYFNIHHPQGQSLNEHQGLFLMQEVVAIVFSQIICVCVRMHMYVSSTELVIHYTVLANRISALYLHVHVAALQHMYVCYSYMYNAYGTYTILCINTVECTVLYVPLRGAMQHFTKTLGCLNASATFTKK